MQHLEQKAPNFPEWALSNFYVLRSNAYLKSARAFQNLGGVNIDYSLLRFESMRPLMQQIESRYVTELIGSVLDAELRPLDTSTDAKKNALLDYARKFIANKTAELYTSEKTLSKSKVNDIRPVYFDLQYTGNFYADQAAFYYGKLEQAYKDYLTSIGQTIANGALEWNEKGKSLFIDIG